MKKIKHIMLCLVAFWAMGISYANAQSVGDKFDAGKFKYKVVSTSPLQVQVEGVSFFSLGATKLEIPAEVTYGASTYSVTGIAESAFAFSSITSLVLPNTLTTIGDMAFASCGKLASVVLPNSLTRIGEASFLQCAKLDTIISNIETVQNVVLGGESVFAGVDFNKCVLTVPFGKIEECRQAQGWQQFSNIVLEKKFSRYITLTVQQGAKINLRLQAEQKNTPVRVISGSTDEEVSVGNSWGDLLEYTAGAETLTVYGEITLFHCDGNGSKVTGIDLSHNDALKEISVDNTKIAHIDLSHSPNLETIGCTNTLIQSLDFSQLPNLKDFACVQGEFTSLDFSNNPKMKSIQCWNNKLTEINITGNTMLETLSCYSNKLTSLDLSGKKKLRYLSCFNNQLTSLDLSETPELTILSCWENRLTTLDVSMNPDLERISCYKNAFTTQTLNDLYCSLPDRSFSTVKGEIAVLENGNDPNLPIVSATCGDNVAQKKWWLKYPRSSTSIKTTGSYTCTNVPPVNQLPVITLTTAKQIGETIKIKIETADNTISWIDINNNGAKDEGEEIRNGYSPGGQNKSYTIVSQTINIYGKVIFLDCGYNQITNIDLSQNNSLLRLYCNDNPISSISFPDKMPLKYFVCDNTQLTSIDATKLANLEVIYARNCNLTSIDITKNKKFGLLNCEDNKLTSLDVTQNPELITLECGRNKLTAVDVSHNLKLKYLGLTENQLTDLDVTHNPLLESLACRHNELRTIDVTQNPELTYCYIGQNKIESINVTNNKKLRGLQCSQNMLRSLDITQNPKLEALDCNSNREIAELDITQNPMLKRLVCYGVGIKLLDVTHNPQLKELFLAYTNLTPETLDDIYCALPARSANNKGIVVVYYGDLLSKNRWRQVVNETNANNATAKNWRVVTWNSNGGFDDIETEGTYMCGTEHPDRLTVAPATLSFTANGENKNVTVSSNTSWSVSSTAEWLSLSASSGNGDATLAVTATANVSTVERAATLTFTSGELTQSVSVTQSGATPTLTVAPTALSFTANGESKNVTVGSNTSWSVSSTAEWLSLSASSGNGDATLAVTATANESITERTATLTFTSGELTQSVSVTQSGATPTLTVAPTALSFVANGESKNVTVGSNTSWSVSSTAEWLSLSASSGNGDATLTVTATANESTTERTATLTFTAGTLTQSVSVTQEPASTDVENVDALNIYAWGTTGKLYIDNKGDKIGVVAEIYTLQGIRVVNISLKEGLNEQHLEKGLYVVRIENSIYKVFVK